jgi:queuine/archaeosine tRNA-ribosyltransferase
MLHFFTALTLCPSDIRKIRDLLDRHGIAENHLRQILFTPLFAPVESLALVRDLKEQTNSVVMFDSGGYYVQVGKLAYQELYYPLLKLYRANPWADIYTLPDHVPTSQDSDETVWRKVRDTAEYTELFFQELPIHLRSRALAVVQGRTREQVDLCLKTYLKLGVSRIGFGSFGTIGKSSGVNIATHSAVELARYVVDVAHKNEITVHFFGLGAPALVAMIYGTGADSFDSSAWIKSAGFGQVYLPFTRGYNITHRNGSSEMQKGIQIEEFEALQILTEHTCPFCSSATELQRHKMYRALHNLVAIQQSVDMVNSSDRGTIARIYENASPRYKEEYQRWLSVI